MTASAASTKEPIHFHFAPGRVLARKYEVLSRVGASCGGELYTLCEQATGIERTAKFFSPTVDPYNRWASRCALKLHKLRHCDILMQYRTQETISVDGRDVTFLVSDFFAGETLLDFIARQPGGRLSVFAGLHVLYTLVCGVEAVHRLGEAHGALDAENILLRRRGLGFQIKLIDLSPEGDQRTDGIKGDVYDLIQLFYSMVGGAKTYVKLPAPVKAICCGLRRNAIAERFRNAGELRTYLETMPWE